MAATFISLITYALIAFEHDEVQGTIVFEHVDNAGMKVSMFHPLKCFIDLTSCPDCIETQTGDLMFEIASDSVFVIRVSLLFQCTIE